MGRFQMVPHRDGDDDAQADVEHDRRRDHEVRMPVGQIEEACQVEGASPTRVVLDASM